MNLNLMEWIADGEGTVTEIAPGEYEVTVETPHTLWCPDPISGDATIAFDCHVLSPNSAMLFMACARNWLGNDLHDTPRTGVYDDYSAGALEMYTVGFNRTGNVTNEIQPNASTANIRRIGGPHLQRFTADKTRLGTDNPDMNAWQDWNTASLLASSREFASGTNQYYSYAFEFARPIIRMILQGEELFTVVDHRADPLCGGFFAIRNMTPGATYRFRNLAIQPHSEAT